ncbi:MAG: T9SS type A sorting domain-containing protein, partial [Endomicrobiia bacterium]|nr:T9SS type A sorting domain-containing protein [Endomicrobiia bacterium]
LGAGVTASVAVAGGRIFVGTNAGSFWAFGCEKIVSINYPDEYDVVVNSVSVSAVIKDEATNAYLLEYKKDTAADWSSITSGASPSAENINVAQWNTGGLQDGSYALRLTANASSARRALAGFIVNNSPPPPTNLAASDAPFDGGGRIVLNWTKSAADGAGSNDVVGYKIYRSTYSGGGFSEIKTVMAGVSSVVDSGVLNQTTYFYRLKAFDSLSDSIEFSNAASAFAVVDGVEVAPGAARVVTLPLADGTTVEALIPESALGESVFIGIRVPPSLPDGGVPASAKKTLRIYEFGATKLNGEKFERFLAPVTIKLPYIASDISGMNEENLRLYRYSDDKSLWQTVNTSFVEPSLRKVGAHVPGFSLYAIMEYVTGAEELISFDKTYAYPNPARGGKARFKYYLGDKADVTVEIYNVDAELVAVLERRDNPAGIASEIEWDVSRVASGVYIWRIEARSASAVKSLKKKLAVIN